AVWSGPQHSRPRVWRARVRRRLKECCWLSPVTTLSPRSGAHNVHIREWNDAELDRVLLPLVGGTNRTFAALHARIPALYCRCSRNTASTLSRPIFSAHACGVAHGSAPASTGSAPRSSRQSHQLGATPPARPSERRAFEQIVADIRPGARIQQHLCEFHDLLGRDVPAHRRPLVLL